MFDILLSNVDIHGEMVAIAVLEVVGNERAQRIALVLTLSIILSTFTGLFAAAGNLEVWDGSTATGFASGTGTAADPYIIENGAQLMDFVLSIASGKQTKTEERGFREISIFKDGVVL